MRLKTSYKYPFLLLTGLILMSGILLCLQTNKKKQDKYPSPPSETVQKTDLSLIQLIVNEKSFNKLKKKRDKAISIGTLEVKDSDFVPATIVFDGVEFRSEIRLKGDWTTHLEGDKWSFRVKLKGDKTILGMRKFSLHHPRSRRYLNEFMYHNAMKAEGLMGLRFDLLEGKIQIKTKTGRYINKDVGIYAMEEAFDKRTIESNKRKESIILKFSEDYWWNEVKKGNQIGNNYGISYNKFLNSQIISTAKYPITVFSESKVLEDSTMRNYFRLSKNLLEDLRQNKINISDAFDIKKLAMDTALMNLFGAIHGTHLINVRYYYNPITSKLEPISFDGNSGVKLTEFRHFSFKGKERDTLFLKELAFALNKVSQPKYVDNLINENKKQLDHYNKILKTEFRGKFFNPENLRFNQNIMRQELMKLKEELELNSLNVEIVKLPREQLKLADLTDISIWTSKQIGLTKSNQKYNNQKVYKAERTSTSKPAFLRHGNIKINNGYNNEVSIIVKKGDVDNMFGLRMQGVYPERVDVIFNLETGKVKGIFKEGSFDEEEATIKPLKNGWYLCTLKARVNINKVNVVFGPTNSEKKPFNWEGPTSKKANVLIIPKSLTITEN